MHTAKKLFLMSVVYVSGLLFGFFVLDHFGIREYRAGDNLALGEIIFPLIVVLSAMMVMGLMVSYAILFADSILLKMRVQKIVIMRVICSVLIGLLPMVIFYLTSLGFLEVVYPHVDYLPFVIGGILVAIILSTKWVR